MTIFSNRVFINLIITVFQNFYNNPTHMQPRNRTNTALLNNFLALIEFDRINREKKASCGEQNSISMCIYMCVFHDPRMYTFAKREKSRSISSLGHSQVFDATARRKEKIEERKREREIPPLLLRYICLLDLFDRIHHAVNCIEAPLFFFLLFFIHLSFLFKRENKVNSYVVSHSQKQCNMPNCVAKVLYSRQNSQKLNFAKHTSKYIRKTRPAKCQRQSYTCINVLPSA